MTRAAKPGVGTGGIFFEVERFDLGPEDRLELRGRWFGVRGRRFVRPTLMVEADGERLRALADLEHKPWAAEDGELWEASFPWQDGMEVLQSELSVAPDIAVDLPAPGPELGPAQRIAALPQPDGKAARPAPRAEGGPSEVERLDSKLAEVRGDLERVKAELEDTLSERESLQRGRHELEAKEDEVREAKTKLAAVLAERDSAVADRETAVAEREAALRDARRAMLARDAALEARDELTAGVERERNAQGQLAAERHQAEQALRRIESDLAQARAALELTARERDEALAAHGAALVMRRATRALPHGHRASWLTRAVAMLMLAIAAVVVLIVLHVF